MKKSLKSCPPLDSDTFVFCFSRFRTTFLSSSFAFTYLLDSSEVDVNSPFIHVYISSICSLTILSSTIFPNWYAITSFLICSCVSNSTWSIISPHSTRPSSIISCILSEIFHNDLADSSSNAFNLFCIPLQNSPVNLIKTWLFNLYKAICFSINLSTNDLLNIIRGSFIISIHIFTYSSMHFSLFFTSFLFM